MSPNNWLNFLNLDFDSAAAQAAMSDPYNQQQQQQQYGSGNGMNNSNGATPTSSVGGNNNNNMLFDFAGLNGSPLSDDLKAQLEAWTNVSFGGEDASNRNSDYANAGNDINDSIFNSTSGNNHLLVGNNTEDYKKDPSPYAKRPFGNFGSNYQALERGFNAFSSHGQDFNSTSGAGGLPAAVDNNQIVRPSTGINAPPPTAANTPAAAASATQAIITQAAELWHKQQQQQQQTTLPVFDFTTGFPADLSAVFKNGSNALQTSNVVDNETSSAPAAKRQKTGATSSSSPDTLGSSSNSNKSPATAPSSAVSSGTDLALAGQTQIEDGEEIERDENGIIVKRQPLLTKAAILAKQLDDLSKLQGRTPQEEALRVAELNRIAAEDDKRRRNTAASARFRVKKKQREAALEDTVSELKTKINGLEQDLVKTKNENAFLRDLVIRKIGLGDLGSGPSSAIQASSSIHTETTGVGTF